MNRLQASIAGVALIAFTGYGCATKKYVRQQVDPVTGRVQTVETKTAENATQINELENNVSQVNERAMGAGKRADQANEAAERANQSAMTAQRRADEVGTMAERRFGEVEQSLSNIDNFQQISAESILFPFGKATLTREGKQRLDQIAGTLQSHNRYVIEVAGFTDRTGNAEYNLALSRKRADAVVRYLTMEHNVPLRRIHVLGAGEVERQQGRETRAMRKEARKVDVKVYGPAMNASGGGQQSGMSGSTGSADRSSSMGQSGYSSHGSHHQNQTGSSNQGSYSSGSSSSQEPGTQGGSSTNTGSQVPRQ